MGLMIWTPIFCGLVTQTLVMSMGREGRVLFQSASEQKALRGCPSNWHATD